MEYLVYLTYTKNKGDHGTFWTPVQKELSFRINSSQHAVFLHNIPLYVISMTPKLFLQQGILFCVSTATYNLMSCSRPNNDNLMSKMGTLSKDSQILHRGVVI